ncbi:MAG: WD40 repeat domain-containing protein, partial [Deltaproteobacteria bacterium]|nr:WD40 repeat domain-containing protein [Deltaproteobacteria bacterium]
MFAILTWDGSSSGTRTGNIETLNGVFAVGSDVWAVGDEGGTFRWKGSSWQRIPSGTTEPLWSLWGSSGTDLWAVGPSGIVLHWDGSAWSTRTAPVPTPRSISGSGASSVWMVGGAGNISRF